MGSRARLIKLLQDIRASYWFLPSSLVICAMILAWATLFLDRHVGDLGFDLPAFLKNTQVDGARTVMSIVSESSFGVAGVMFSMTMVAVSFASGNFGPRLIGNFMRDRGNQWSLGILVATFVYALLITRAIQTATPDDAQTAIEAFVPHISIFTALLLMTLSVFVVIYFVHHIPETINVSNITASLGDRLCEALRNRIEEQQEENRDGTRIDWAERSADLSLTLGVSGYIQTLNKAELSKLAREHNLLIEVTAPVGTFVTPDTAVLRAWGQVQDGVSESDLINCFASGNSRTEHQNLLFIVDQLVEMIARALSPGVNDPFTAINCMNWLFSAMVVAANHRGGLTETPDGRVRISEVTFLRLLEQGFAQSRPYTKSDPLTDAHLQELLARMEREITTLRHLKTLRSFRRTLDKAE
ncbi:DUF2254 domain-containing protein [Arenibacterium halophilum]|uniref:DUF2254 domain-containing protein n=1 Tax=Arenibacterium halophilum TaxID=2583821 RepID=A0ABY2X6T3_9RHOB|nr:DUF2254 domain-containing protein [Arenibacterium halophilum]TMV11480.1 DUF2254 domain-containing protein [Arenibacterium halophilum]